MVSCSLAAARVAARLTARVVQPTPPAAPVTVMIRGPCSLVVFDSFRPRASLEMISSTSADSAGSVRNSRAPARMAFKIKPLSAATARGQHDLRRRCLVQFLDQIDGLVGVVVEDDDREVRGDFLGAVRGLFDSCVKTSESQRDVIPPSSRCKEVLDSSMGSTTTIRITSFMVFDSG